MDSHSNLPISRSRLAPLLKPIDAFLSAESGGGIVLMVSTLIALVWANSPWAAGYLHFWHSEILLRARGFSRAISLEECVNDGLMVIFFLLVGLEIKRELLMGELASMRRAALPIAAAVGGMVVPALIYSALNKHGAGAAGWGVPMATDIAFAVGVLSLVGRGVPTSVKVFLLAIAIVDDLGAVLVIAVFYSHGISWVALALAGVCLMGLIGLNLLRVQSPWPYLLVGVVLWMATLFSGIHATIAGVLLAFTIPASRSTEQASQGMQTPLMRVEHALLKPVNFLMVPLFALANAGVNFRGGGAVAFHSPIAWGVLLGLFVGKPVGVLLASWAAVKSGMAALPERASPRQIFGVAVLCGIGFTMSLFVANLAFPGQEEHLSAAKIGILMASLIAGLVGGAIFATSRSTDFIE